MQGGYGISQARQVPWKTHGLDGNECSGPHPIGSFQRKREWGVYKEKVLKKVIVDDVLQRKKSLCLPIHKRKLFAKNSDMIFEQDFAQAHSTNECQNFMEEHFPAHTPTLWRFEDSDPLFFGPKWDDFWSIERLWAIQSQRVYRNPRPTSGGGEKHRPENTHPTRSRASCKDERNLSSEGEENPLEF